jgi:NADPH:quinone reductase-like Zn-dependent oxidoreductase
VQIARSLGAEVTGVCSTRNFELVSTPGADHLIDNTQEDFTRSRDRYDPILDNALNHPPSATARVLAPGGVFMPNSVGNTRGLFAGLPRMTRAALIRLGSTTVRFVTWPVGRET